MFIVVVLDIRASICLIAGVVLLWTKAWLGDAAAIASAVTTFAFSNGLERLVEIRDVLREIPDRRPASSAACNQARPSRHPGALTLTLVTYRTVRNKDGVPEEGKRRIGCMTDPKRQRGDRC